MDVSCKGWVFIQASVTALLPSCQLRWMNQSTEMNEGTNHWKRWSTSLLTVLSEKQEILQNVCGRVQGCLNSVVLTIQLSGNDFGSFNAVHHTMYWPNWNILLYLIMVKIMKNEATDIIDFWKCKFQSYKCFFSPRSGRAAGQTSPVNTFTSILIHGSFSNFARTFITLRSQTSLIMEVLPY